MKERWLGRALFAALVVDVGVYGLMGRTSAFVDGLAWLVLLALFMWETRHERPWPRPLLPLLHGVRLVCAVGVLGAAVAYVREREWLDAANAALWLAVVLLLEAELRWPHLARHRLFADVAFALYAGLGLIVLFWLKEGEWLDAFDGALWLAAFFLIELDLLGRGRTRQG